MRSARGTVRFTIVIWPPPTSSLSFTSEKSGSMPVVSQSIRKLIVPGRREHRRLRVAVPVALAELDRLVPRAPRRLEQAGLDVLVDLVRRVAVLAHHAQVRLAVLGELVVRAHRGRELSRGAVGAAGHQRRDRGRHRAALVRVVGQAARHQQRAEVRVAEAELAHRARVAADLLGRVARTARR